MAGLFPIIPTLADWSQDKHQYRSEGKNSSGEPLGPMLWSGLWSQLATKCVTFSSAPIQSCLL
jgi:hypothetical protein